MAFGPTGAFGGATWGGVGFRRLFCPICSSSNELLCLLAISRSGEWISLGHYQYRVEAKLCESGCECAEVERFRRFV